MQLSDLCNGIFTRGDGGQNSCKRMFVKSDGGQNCWKGTFRRGNFFGPLSKSYTTSLIFLYLIPAASIPAIIKQILRDIKGVTDWFSLGVHLEIEYSVLDKIRKGYESDIEQCKIEVINFWLRNDKDPSWSKLAKAVEDIGGYSNIVLTLRKNQG